MDLRISEPAAELLRARGGTAALDFITPVSCGGRAEVAVDTYLRGKDTSSYTPVEHDDVRVLISPALQRWAEDVQLDVRSSLLRKRFAVTVAHHHTASCRH